MLTEMILKEAQAKSAYLEECRHWLHANAETGFHLSHTIEFVRQQLISYGCEPVACGKAGLVTTIGDPTKGKVFLLRADMDGLEITEQSGVVFASHNGNMHACGHDMHTAMLLGAAKLLKRHEDQLMGAVKLMFQPAEETLEGCKDMIENGILEEPHVDAALMIHLMTGVQISTGTIIVAGPGISAPAADYFTIHIQGKGCHGSTPESGIDPLTAASHILIALQELQARELAASDEAVLTIGMIHGGKAANVIPDTVVMAGTFRSFDDRTQKMLRQRIVEIATGVSSAFRTAAEVSFGPSCPALLNDEQLVIDVRKYLSGLLGKSAVLGAESFHRNSKSQKSSGSEDFAYISHQVPSVMLALAAGEPENGYRYGLHHPKVQFDDHVLPIGAAIHATVALQWLEEHSKNRK